VTNAKKDKTSGEGDGTKIESFTAEKLEQRFNMAKLYI